jgi:hypothetical protein
VRVVANQPLVAKAITLAVVTGRTDAIASIAVVGAGARLTAS